MCARFSYSLHVSLPLKSVEPLLLCTGYKLSLVDCVYDCQVGHSATVEAPAEKMFFSKTIVMTSTKKGFLILPAIRDFRFLHSCCSPFITIVQISITSFDGATRPARFLAAIRPVSSYDCSAAQYSQLIEADPLRATNLSVYSITVLETTVWLQVSAAWMHAQLLKFWTKFRIYKLFCF